jgi:uncharacterized protein (TIGR02285 family)
MRKLIHTLLAQTLLLASGTGLAWAGPARIEWLLADFPPYEIGSGPNKGNGLIDHFRQQLVLRLPQYEHASSIVGMQRREEMMRRAPYTVCAVTMFRTPEREQFARFAAHPFLYLMPPRLITTAATAASLQADLEDGALPLLKVLTKGTHYLGVFGRRRYGEYIDQQLAQLRQVRPEAFRYFQEQGGASIGDLLKILDRGRFDMTIGYVAEAEALRRAQPTLPQLTYFPILGAEKLVPAQIDCNRTPLGIEVIDAVDAMPASDPLFAGVLNEYESLMPAEERKRYERALQALGSQ